MTPSNLPVTCIIPVKDGASTIERAIKSSIDAGCDHVFVYDDASTDNTMDILANHLIGKYEQLAWPRGGTVRHGVNHARNHLIDCAHDGLIIPLDADDTLNDIAPLVAAWQPDTWVYGNHIERCEGSEDVLVDGLPAGLLPRKNITGVTFLFSKEDWQRVGGYDPDFAYAEDYGYMCNLTHNGVKPVYVDTTVYTRYMRLEGNERSALANTYWSFYRDMARRKYPSVFAGTG